MQPTSRSSSPSRDLLTIDLCGLKAAVVQQAIDRNVTASAVVREALVRSGLSDVGVAAPHVNRALAEQRLAQKRVRVSMRLSSAQAQELASSARTSGLTLSNYVAELRHFGHMVPRAEDRLASTTALVRSNSELSMLSRNIAHLVELLKQGQSLAAQEYSQTLETLTTEIRAHLELSARLLADHTRSRSAN
jgi:hypothetical protein